jgi:hypothetical protein
MCIERHPYLLAKATCMSHDLEDRFRIARPTTDVEGAAQRGIILGSIPKLFLPLQHHVEGIIRKR